MKFYLIIEKNEIVENTMYNSVTYLCKKGITTREI